MHDYIVNNESYLYSLKPKYYCLLYSIILSIIIIISTLFIFKTYDVYSSKAYISCDDKCYINLTIDYLSVDKINKIDFLKLDNNKLYPKNINIGDIEVDELTKSNYQIVRYEVDQLDDGIVNTFQDVKLYSNNEYLIKKLINIFK